MAAEDIQDPGPADPPEAFRIFFQWKNVSGILGNFQAGLCVWCDPCRYCVAGGGRSGTLYTVNNFLYVAPHLL